MRRERHVAAVSHLSVTSSATATASKSVHQSSLAALTLGALGVVYGDIGTSVLYALKEVFATGLIAFTPDNVLGYPLAVCLDADFDRVLQICHVGAACR